MGCSWVNCQQSVCHIQSVVISLVGSSFVAVVMTNCFSVVKGVRCGCGVWNRVVHNTRGVPGRHSCYSSKVTSVIYLINYNKCQAGFTVVDTNEWASCVAIVAWLNASRSVELVLY